MDTYNYDQITILSVEPVGEDAVKVRYRIMLETLYFCPGANMEVNQNETLITFVRCPINKICAVTNVANKESSGEDSIMVANNKTPIYIVSDGAKKKIYPQ